MHRHYEIGSMIKKVIFIDEANTGLSAFAAALFRKKLLEAGSGIRTDSKGTVVLFPEPANKKLSDIAPQFGVSLYNHRASQLCSEDFGEDVLILALDNASKRLAFTFKEGFADIFTIREYLGESGDIKLPIGSGADSYEAVCNIINNLLEYLMEKFKEEGIL